MDKQRVEYYDFFKGIAIIMVVGVHTFHTEPLDTISGFCSLFVRQLLNCAVPIFLASSGYFCGKKLLNTKENRIKFWKKQICKIYIPTIIWSIPFFIIGTNFNDISLKNIARGVILLLICGYSFYYFIALIIQFYLLLPILQKYKSLMMTISIVSSFISVSIITYIYTIKGAGLPLIVYAGPFITWFMFFMIGVYYSNKQESFSLKFSVSILIIGFVLEICETYWLNINYGGGMGLKISSFIYSIGVILLILSPQLQSKYKSNIFNSIIAYIGRISFSIYLIHYFVMMLISILYNFENWLLYWLISILTTTLIITISKKVLPPTINNAIGFV